MTLQLTDLQAAVVRDGLYRVFGAVYVYLEHETVLTADEERRRAARGLYDVLVTYNPATGNEELAE